MNKEIPIKIDRTLQKDGWWVDIAGKNSLKHLIDATGIVINSNVITLIVHYPLKKAYSFKIKAKNNKNFSRLELVEAIRNTYQKIYKTEEETTKTKTIPINKRGSCFNRNATNGKYGIWGHDIGDLVIEGINITEEKNKIFVHLSIGS